MVIFESTEQFEKILTGFFQMISDTPDVANQFLESKLIFRLKHTAPESVIVIDCTGEKIKITTGDIKTDAQIEIAMQSDVAHKFWLGKVDLKKALLEGKVETKGSVPRILGLLPAIEQTYNIYPQYLKDYGYQTYIS